MEADAYSVGNWRDFMESLLLLLLHVQAAVKEFITKHHTHMFCTLVWQYGVLAGKAVHFTKVACIIL